MFDFEFDLYDEERDVSTVINVYDFEGGSLDYTVEVNGKPVNRYEYTGHTEAAIAEMAHEAYNRALSDSRYERNLK